MVGKRTALRKPGRGRFAAAAAAYEPMRRADGTLPSSWEVIYAHAWAPDLIHTLQQAVTTESSPIKQISTSPNEPV